MQGMSAASVVSGPLLTSGRAAKDFEGAVSEDGHDDDPQVRAVLSHPLVTPLPPAPMSSTSIKLTWQVGGGGRIEAVRDGGVRRKIGEMRRGRGKDRCDCVGVGENENRKKRK